MDRSDAKRIVHALDGFVADGRGDVKALKGALKGRYRLRMGKWRVFFSFDQPGNVVGDRRRQPWPGLLTLRIPQLCHPPHEESNHRRQFFPREPADYAAWTSTVSTMEVGSGMCSP